MAGDERVVIQAAAANLDRYRDLGVGLSVTVELDGDNVVVVGDDLDAYLMLLDPNVWDPKQSRGDA